MVRVSVFCIVSCEKKRFFCCIYVILCLDFEKGWLLMLRDFVKCRWGEVVNCLVSIFNRVVLLDFDGFIMVSNFFVLVFLFIFCSNFLIIFLCLLCKMYLMWFYVIVIGIIFMVGDFLFFSFLFFICLLWLFLVFCFDMNWRVRVVIFVVIMVVIFGGIILFNFYMYLLNLELFLNLIL